MLLDRLAADLAVEVAEDALDLAAEVLLKVVLALLGVGEGAEGGEGILVVLVVADSDVESGLLE